MLTYDRSKLEFDPGPHIYRYAGRVVPSVTQIIGEILEPEQFTHVDSTALAAAAELGRDVHEAIRQYNIGQSPILCTGLAQGYLAQWDEFVASGIVKVLESEQLVYSALHGYAGGFDATVTARKRLGILEVKTTAQVPKSVGAQLEAYRQCMTPRPALRFCLMLTAHNYRLIECKALGDWNLFTSALNVWRYRHG